MTGEQLFNAYVNNGLCTSFVYEWAKLSIPMQVRWENLAKDVVRLINSPKTGE